MPQKSIIESDRQFQRLSSLYIIGKAMGSTIILDELLDLIMDSCIAELEADTGSIMLLDEEKEELTISVARGLPQEVISNTKIKLGDGIAGTVAKEGEPLLLIGKVSDLRFRKIREKEKIKSAMCVPLSVRDKVIGVISVNRQIKPIDYTSEDLGLLSLFASQAASALANAELYSRAESRIHELTKINEITQTLNSIRTEEGIFRLIADALYEIIGFDFCALLLYESDERSWMWVKTPYSLPRRYFSEIKNKLLSTFTDLSDINIANEHLSIEVDKIGQLSDKLVPLGGKRFESFLALPLVVRGNVLGLLNICRLQERAFNPDNLRVLSTLANTGAISLENARLYRGMKQKVSELSTLFEVGKTISSTLDLEKVLTLILEVAARLMEASICSLRLIGEEKEIVLNASYGLTTEYFWGKRTTIDKRKSIAEQALKERNPVIITDVPNDKEYEYPEYATKEKVTSLLCVPLVVKEESVGVLTIYSTRRQRYTQDQVNLLSAIADQAAIAVSNAKLHEEIHYSFLRTVKALAAAVDAKDPYTKGHSEAVVKYTLEIATELGFSKEEIEFLEIAALLHDIGKIGIKEDVLLKPGKLDEEEWRIIKEHPTISAKILGPVEFPEVIMLAVRLHHEQIDGKGYPDGLSQEEIPLQASIIKVADAFDAMISDRPYRKALSREVAINELKRGSGTQFHPKVVDTFIKILERSQEDYGTQMQVAS
ncbi:MAG: GAF domain-containing protein [bacterium]